MFDSMCFGEALPRRALDPRVTRAIARIGKFSGEPVTAATCATEAGLSSSRFLHLFKEETGIAFRSFRARSPATVAAAWPAIVIYVALGLGVTATVEWLASGVAMRECRRHQNFAGHDGDERFYDVGCRARAGARLGEKTRVSYVEPAGLYLYAGCRPTFVAGPSASLQKIKVGRPQFGRPAIEEIDRNMLSPEAPLAVACLSGVPSSDLVCGHGLARRACDKAGSAFETCTLSAPERARLLGRAP